MKDTVLACLLATVTTLGSAAEITVGFRYSDLVVTNASPVTWPGDLIDAVGSFSGADANGDGYLTAPEVLQGALNVGTLGGNALVQQLRYDIAANQLQQLWIQGSQNTPSWWESYEMTYGLDSSADALRGCVGGPPFVCFGAEPGPQTRLEVWSNAAPVPEPATALLLGVGLAPLAWRRRRSRGA